MVGTMIKTFFLRGLFLGLLFLSACNLFNPSGEGDIPEDAGGALSVGQSRLKAKDWDGAIEAFTKAIAADSTNSLAYYSLAKAYRFKYDLNGLALSKELTDTAGNQIPFISLGKDSASFDTATRYLQATYRMKPVLEALIHRDTTNRYMKVYFQKIAQGTIDTSNCAKLDTACIVYSWHQKFKAGDSSYYSFEKYPLMDGVINFEKVTVDFTMVLLLNTVISLKDIQRDSVINGDDKLETVNKLLDLFSGKDGEKPSADNIEEKLQSLFDSTSTPEAQQQVASDINSVLSNLSEGTESITQISSLLSGFGISTGGSTGSEGDTGTSSQGELNNDINETVKGLGDKIVFYKFADSLDNDGDGCIDEEVPDGKDNDGDGYVDEDSRLPYADYTLPFSKDFFVRLTDPRATGGAFIEVTAEKKIKQFADKPDYWVVQPESTRDSLRFIMIDHQKKEVDKLPPYQYITENKTILDFGKQKIGGCWNEF